MLRNSGNTLPDKDAVSGKDLDLSQNNLAIQAL